MRNHLLEDDGGQDPRRVRAQIQLSRGVVPCVGAVSTSFETDVDLTPEAPGAAFSVVKVASTASCVDRVLVITSASSPTT